MQGKLTYSNVMSTIAVFLALAGGSFAVAAALEKDSVKSKHVKDGALQQRDLKADESAHVVGSPGEPVFGTGGDNDCLWNDASVAGLPAGFYKDKLDRVHLQGTLGASNGPAGDGACDTTTSAETIQDGSAFVLPSGYRPDKPITLASFGGGEPVIVLVGADEDTGISGGVNLPAGTVVFFNGDGSDIPVATTVDSLDFRVSSTEPGRRVSRNAGPALEAVLGGFPGSK